MSISDSPADSPADSPDRFANADDFPRLMEAFVRQARQAVHCDGIKFRADTMSQHFITGIMENYLCCFEIKIRGKSFGTIYFARETAFEDPELSTLENMVAGLVLPLCKLFQAEFATEDGCDSALDENPFTIPGNICLQQI